MAGVAVAARRTCVMMSMSSALKAGGKGEAYTVMSHLVSERQDSK